MRVLFLILILNVYSVVIAQDIKNSLNKPCLDVSVFGSWPSVEAPLISTDGRFASYIVRNHPGRGKTLVIQSLVNSFRFETPGASNVSFTKDCQKAIFVGSNDSLYILSLNNGGIDFIANALTYKLLSYDNEEWLVYHSNTINKNLIVYRLKNKTEKIFKNVTSYSCGLIGNVLLVQPVEKSNERTSMALSCVNIKTGEIIKIWEGFKAKNFVFDKSGNQTAFIGEKENINLNSPFEAKNIWYYKIGTTTSRALVYNKKNVDSTLEIDGISYYGFSIDGSKLYVNLKESVINNTKSNFVSVDVWSYKDAKLQSLQLNELQPKIYNGFIVIANNEVVQLNKADEQLSFFLSNKSEFALIIDRNGGDFHERHWSRAARPSYYLVSLNNGKKVAIDMLALDISPRGKYIVLVDSINRDLYSYELHSDLKRNITNSISIPNSDPQFDYPGVSPKDLMVAGWIEEDESLLIYDKYDVWLIDPSGKNSPICVTNQYGRKNDIVFRLAEDFNAASIPNKTRLIFTAFDKKSKKNGFYSKSLLESGDPKFLTMGNYFYENIPGSSSSIRKVENKKAYIVYRMAVDQSPNYFYTQDFKEFSPITHLHPESSWNWMDSDLHTYKTLDGRLSQGVMYKPKNFDPQKKYPIIFHYYDKMADELNKFKTPGPTSYGINIPWFVSNGYIVFTPDIQYTVGEPGPSAYNSVLGAVKYLSNIPWIDSNKMGIQGHSFGGFETNYIVSHTSIFAAAVSGAGPSNLVSIYGSLRGEGFSFQEYLERDRLRMGATMWERPDLYLHNSPILNADKIVTPFLLLNNKNDVAVPFGQGVELFTALRRLGKKAWMLQYDNGNHGVSGKDAEDYTIRMTQFFDHYLKDKPAPKWMTRGVPARLKGVYNGLELDIESGSPGRGLIY